MYRNLGPVRIADFELGGVRYVQVQVHAGDNHWTTTHSSIYKDSSTLAQAEQIAQETVDNIKKARVVVHGVNLSSGTSISGGHCRHLMLHCN